MNDEQISQACANTASIMHWDKSTPEGQVQIDHLKEALELIRSQDGHPGSDTWRFVVE